MKGNGLQLFGVLNKLNLFGSVAIAIAAAWMGACTPKPVDPDPAGPPRVSGDEYVAWQGRLYDAEDRELLLRGVNARVDGIFDVTFDDGRKALEPIPPFEPSDCAFLARELGMNHLRLPVNWSGIEPTKGAYDTAYLERIVRLVEGCHAHGVLTVVDLHQDAYSKHIGEDGAPLWAIVPPPQQLLEGPLHDLEARRTSDQVLDAFESFWDNTEALQDAYAAMAARLAEQLLGIPGVIGIEVMNEPVLVAADAAALTAFHRKVAAAIRAVDPTVTIIFEPNALRNFLDQDPVDAPLELDDTLYAPHIYTQVFTNGWSGRNTAAVFDSVAEARKEADAHGGAGLYIGEFGNDPKTETGRLYVETALDAFDEQRAGYAFWVYEEWSQGSWGLFEISGTTTDPGRGPLRPAIADLLARPYPVALDAAIESLRFDVATRTLTVEIRNASTGEHVLSVPRRTYPKSGRVLCDGVAAVTKTAGLGRVSVVCSGRQLQLYPIME